MEKEREGKKPAMILDIIILDKMRH